MPSFASPLVLATSLLGLVSCATPVGETSNIEVRALNMSLAGVAQRHHCTFMDTYSILMGSNGKPLGFFFMPDGEHLSGLGYRRWADGLLVPYLKGTKYAKVAMVGDSITRRVFVVPAGAGASETTWSDLLGVEAVNDGVDGETTEDVLRRLDRIVDPTVECYFVMVGNNDLHAGVPVSEVARRVEALVTELKDRSGRPVVLQAVMPLLL